MLCVLNNHQLLYFVMYQSCTIITVMYQQIYIIFLFYHIIGSMKYLVNTLPFFFIIKKYSINEIIFFFLFYYNIIEFNYTFVISFTLIYFIYNCTYEITVFFVVKFTYFVCVLNQFQFLKIL